jgi:hypothetical protein
MTIVTDFSIALNGDIRHVAGTEQFTVLDLHRFLQDNADNASAATSDDLINITSADPSSRATDQIVTLLGTYNIDDTAAQFLYGGSIRQGSGATEVLYSGLQVVGAVNDPDTEIEVVQNNALITNYWGTGNNASGSILNRILVKSRDAGRDIDARQVRVQAREYVDASAAADTYAEFSVTLGEGEAVAAIFTQDDLNNDTLHATVIAYDKHDNTEGFQALNIGAAAGTENYYSQWTITGTGTLPASEDLKSLYEYTKAITARNSTTQVYGMDGELFRGITHSIAYDGGIQTWTQNEEICWGTTFAFDAGSAPTTSFTIGEKVDFGTSNAVGTVLKVDNTATGEAVVAIEPGTGTVVDNEVCTGASSGATMTVDGATRLVNTSAVGGTAAVLAADDAGATGVLYVQLLTGSAPVNDLPVHGITSDSESPVNGTPTVRTLTPAFLGTFTGTALIGSYGIGLDPTDTTSSDLFFPLDSDPSGVSPPNNVTFTINGLVAGDRLMVGPDNAGAFLTTQMATAATYSSTTTTIDVAAIPDHTPQTGNIRVITDGGTHLLATYTGHNGTTQFTGVTADFTGDTATSGNDAYLTYIDKVAAGTSENFNTIFSGSNLALRARVREGSTPGSEIKEATGTGTLSTTGGSININRIADT